jgi:hypothetical protein
MMQAALQLLCHNYLTHLQIHLLQPQEGGALIQPPMKGFVPFGSRAKSGYLGEVVTPSDTHVGATGVTSCTRLPERVGGDQQALLPRDDGALSAVQLPFSGKELLL